MKQILLLFLLSSIASFSTAQTFPVDAGMDAHICADSAPGVILSPTINGGMGPYSYSWTPSAGLNSTFILNPYARPAVTTTYHLTVTDANNNTGTDSVTVFVHPLPTVNAGPIYEICLGDSVMLDGEASGDSSSNGYTYSWSPFFTLLNANVEDPIAFPDTTTTYYLTAFSSWGCPSNTDSTTVFLNPTPIAEAGVNDVICAGDSLKLNGSFYYTTTPQAPPAQVFFAWSPADDLSDSTLADPWASPPTTTWYYLEVSYATCTTVDSVLLTVISGPATGIQYQAGVFTALGATGGGNYQWYRDSVLIPGAVLPTYTPNQIGCYYFSAEEGGCTFDSDTLCLTTVDREDASPLAEVQLFPNPVDEELYLDLGDVKGGQWQVSVADIAGRILSMRSYPSQGVLDLSGQVNDLPPGVYFLGIVGRNGLLSREKIVKR